MTTIRRAVGIVPYRNSAHGPMRCAYSMPMERISANLPAAR